MNGRVTATVVAAMLTLAGCRSTQPVPGRMAEAPPNEVSGVQIPGGRVDDAVSKLDGLAADVMKETGIPGMAVAVVHGGKPVFVKGFGVRDVRSGVRVGPDTVFQLASVSKSLGATVVAHEVSEHIVSWDTPVVEKLPWFALSDPYATQHVTIADLYAHRSGLPEHAGDELEDLGYDRRQVLERLKYSKLSPFRDSYSYTNFGLTAAAEAVGVAAGKSWEDLSRDVLYRPLGMTSTSSTYADFTARPDHAVNHVNVGGRYEPRYQRNPDAQSAAGGASSSANDMARWLIMMLANGTYAGRQIASPQALLPAVTPQVISGPAAVPKARSGFYGYGFNASVTSSGRTEYSHSGAFSLGAATAFAALPSEDVGIVVLTNAAPIGVPETVTAEFLDLVQYGQVRENWSRLYRQAFESMDKPRGSLVGKQPPEHPVSTRPLDEYTGRYGNDYWGSATVTARGGALELSLGPGNQVFPLRHWEGDTFVFLLSGENAPPGTISKATFAGDALVLEYYDQAGLGTFTR
jgi:CubicO group peptidase (beta-lactamase class C family)